MLMPGRHANTADYRYGFQGQEMDDEIKGEGNSLNYTFRMHDPRVGRFFTVDPLEKKYPNYTPYSFSGNKVINSIEIEGLEDSFFMAGKKEYEGEVYFELINIHELIQTVTNVLRLQINNNAVRFKNYIPDDALVYANPAFMESIFLNV